MCNPVGASSGLQSYFSTVCALYYFPWRLIKHALDALSERQLLRTLDESFGLLLSQLKEAKYVKKDCLTVEFSIPLLIKVRLDRAGLGDKFSHGSTSIIKSQTNRG